MESKVKVMMGFTDDRGNQTIKNVVMNLPEEVIFEREEKVWAITLRGERLAREKIVELYGERHYFIYSGVTLV